ncbi:MAG: hypothetical protein KAQ85_04180 [Thermodesulfovibrionia bacterium]|nr:hypothetical protein [Thermodesulfovibrionia bacterium]
MKRFIIIFISLLLAGVSYGQSVKSLKNTVNVYRDLSETENTYWFRTKPAADTINQTDTIWSYTFGIDNLYDQNKQYLKIVLDSISGTPLTTITWQGKYFWDDAAWTTVSTVTWSGTTADTTLLIDQSTAKHYRFYRLYHDGDGTGTFKYAINKQQLQYYK